MLPDPGLALLPVRLHELSLTQPAVARNILKLVACDRCYRFAAGIHSMRGASQLLRTAVNSTVKKLRIALHGCQAQAGYSGGCYQSGQPLVLTSDLGATFPNAVDFLALLQHATSSLDLAHLLQGLADLCPILLPRLQHMHLHLRSDPLDSKLVLLALNRLLSKWVLPVNMYPGNRPHSTQQHKVSFPIGHPCQSALLLLHSMGSIGQSDRSAACVIFISTVSKTAAHSSIPKAPHSMLHRMYCDATFIYTRP
jgi:hypothetical protein